MNIVRTAAAVAGLLAISCAQRGTLQGSAMVTADAGASRGAITAMELEVQPANIQVPLERDGATGSFGVTVSVPEGVQTFTVRAYAGAELVGTGTATATIATDQTVIVVVPIVVAAPTYVISGTVSGGVAAGVTMSLTGSATATTTTDAVGHYEFTRLTDGNYTVTPGMSGYVFSPASIAVAVSGRNVSGNDFTSAAAGPGSWTRIATGTFDAPQDVWGSGPRDVWMVGGSAIRRWNGTAWSSTSSGAQLRGLWGASANDVWAVGGGASGGLILHWDGAAWTPALTGDGAFRAVWGSGANDVWVAGTGATVMHWNGTAWSSVPTGGSQLDIYNRIFGSGASDVWFVGRPLRHWDGSVWSTVSIPTTTYLWGVWGSGAGDVWAVGNHSSTGAGIIMHWNGSAWSSASIGMNPFYAVWGSASNDVWAAGGGDVVQHWDGTAWSSVPTGTGAHSIWSLWGSDANNIWAPAWDSNGLGTGLILEYHR